MHRDRRQAWRSLAASAEDTTHIAVRKYTSSARINNTNVGTQYDRGPRAVRTHIEGFPSVIQKRDIQRAPKVRPSRCARNVSNRCPQVR